MMATAVLDLEFNDLPAEVAGLDGYQRALVLIRLNGRPVGQALLPIVDGRLGREADLRSALMCAADSAFWEAWLRTQIGISDRPARNGPLPTATIAVCTRDRPDDLRHCLDALMQLPDDGQEILIIDNAPSTDATRQLVAGYGRVRYVREDRPGLDNARNRALREACHDFIAFTDDDALPDPDWLRALLRNFDNPSVLCVTGLTMPLELETEAQEWFQRLGGFGRGFRRRIFDSAYSHPLDAWTAGAGVNMAFRRDLLLDRVGPFHEALDVGTPTQGGGDTEMFIRVLNAGYRIVYDPEALNWHRHRREWKLLRRQLHGYEVAGTAIWFHYLIRGDLDVLYKLWQWLGRESQVVLSTIFNRPGSTPRDIVLARLHGAGIGPWMYLYSNLALLWRKWSDERRRHGVRSSH